MGTFSKIIKLVKCIYKEKSNSPEESDNTPLDKIADSLDNSLDSTQHFLQSVLGNEGAKKAKAVFQVLKNLYTLYKIGC